MPPEIAAQPASHRELIRRQLPRVVLESAKGRVALGELADEHDLVVYVYPGSEQSRIGEDVPRVDGILHRAFRAGATTLLASGFHVLGISSQPVKAQRRVVVNNRLGHRMLSDPHLLLARELGLPTFATDRGCWYQRAILVVRGGCIEWAQFPVREASRAAAHATAWIRTQDTETSGWPDVS